MDSGDGASEEVESDVDWDESALKALDEVEGQLDTGGQLGQQRRPFARDDSDREAVRDTRYDQKPFKALWQGRGDARIDTPGHEDDDDDFPEIDLDLDELTGYRLAKTGNAARHEERAADDAQQKGTPSRDSRELQARLEALEESNRKAAEEIAKLTKLADTRAGEVSNVRRLLQKHIDAHSAKEKDWAAQKEDAEKQLTDQRKKFQHELKSMQDEFVFKRMEVDTSIKKGALGGWNTIRRRTPLATAAVNGSQESARPLPQTPVPVHRRPLAPLSQQAELAAVQADNATAHRFPRPKALRPIARAEVKKATPRKSFAMVNAFEESPPRKQIRADPLDEAQSESSPASQVGVIADEELLEDDAESLEAASEVELDTRLILLQELFKLTLFPSEEQKLTALQILIGSSSEADIPEIAEYDQLIGRLLQVISRIASWGENGDEEVIVTEHNDSSLWDVMTESASIALLVVLNLILRFAIDHKWAKPISPALLIIGYLLWQSPATCDFALMSPTYDSYRERHALEQTNVGLDLCSIIALFCDSYDDWLAAKEAVERAKKEAQATELANRQSGIRTFKWPPTKNEAEAPPSPSGPVDEDLALVALRHLDILRLDLSSSSEDGLIAVIRSKTLPRLLNLSYPPRCLEQVFYILHSLAYASDRIADEIVSGFASTLSIGFDRKESPIVLQCCKILTDTIFSVLFDEILSLHSAILSFLFALFSHHDRAAAFLAHSVVLLPTLLHYAGHQVSVLWDSTDTPSQKLLELNTLSIRLIHAIASQSENLEAILASSRRTHQIFLLTMSRIGLSEEAQEFFDKKIIDLARDLLEQVLSPEEEEELYMTYLPPDEVDQTPESDVPAHVKLFEQLALAAPPEQNILESSDEDSEDEATPFESDLDIAT